MPTRQLVRRHGLPYAGGMRKRSGAVVCPGCGRLVDVNEPRCPYCGQGAPGMFGYGPAIQGLANRLNLSFGIIAACTGLYVIALLLDPSAIMRMRGIFDLLSPSSAALAVLGMTGKFAMGQGRWWTLLTAIFLHGSLLHLAFNMVIMRQFLGNVVELFGAARAWIIFVVAGVVGFVLSNLATGAPTIGASGSIFGLLGAMIVYGRRTGQHSVTQQLWSSAAVMFLFGFFMPGINNWAHAGGFAGGFVTAEALSFSDRREGPGVLVLSGLTALAVVAAFAAQIVRLVRAMLGG
jgi:rhomboid protease GluP